MGHSGKFGIIIIKYLVAKNRMLRLKFFGENQEPKILCLGAHADDIEIGCGGTILKLIQQVPKAQFYWVVFSGNENRANEAYLSGNLFLNEVKSKHIDVKNFRESYFPFVGDEIKDYFEGLSKMFSPDLV